MVSRFNCIADSISRQELWKLKELAPDFQELPETIPQEFVDLISGLKLAGLWMPRKQQFLTIDHLMTRKP
jgi:hypothetical protein